MNWTDLNTPAQLDAIDVASHHAPVLIFKHSTRCNISSAAMDRLERQWTPVDDAGRKVYHLDLLKYRSLSNAIAQRYGVEHASPQVLVVREGRCVYSASHFDITYAGVLAKLVA